MIDLLVRTPHSTQSALVPSPQEAEAGSLPMPDAAASGQKVGPRQHILLVHYLPRQDAVARVQTA